MYAQLVSVFRIRPCDIADLTDRQIYDVYFYPRDKTGELKKPSVSVSDSEDKPLTREEERQTFFGMGQVLGIPYEDLLREWQTKRGEVENDSELS